MAQMIAYQRSRVVPMMGELADRPCTSQKPNCRILMHLVEKITPEERSLDERYSTMPSGGGESQIARGNTELLSLARPATYIADLVSDNNDLSGEYRRRLMGEVEDELELLAQMWETSSRPRMRN